VFCDKAVLGGARSFDRQCCAAHRTEPSLLNPAHEETLSNSAAQNSGAAGRYTAAMFELAESAGALDTVEKEFQELGAVLESNTELSHVISSPAFSREQQSGAIGALAAKLGHSEMTRNFLGLMGSKGRLALLPETISGFEALVAEHRGNFAAEVTTAKPMSDMQRNALAENLRNSLGRSVRIEENVDPSILGGLIVKVGSKMVDSSLKSQLERLETAMKES